MTEVKFEALVELSRSLLRDLFPKLALGFHTRDFYIMTRCEKITPLISIFQYVIDIHLYMLLNLLLYRQVVNKNIFFTY